MTAKETGAGVDTDSLIVFLVGHGIHGVKAERPEDGSSPEEPNAPGQGCGDSAPANQDGKAPAEGKDELGNGEDALGGRVEDDEGNGCKTQGNTEGIEVVGESPGTEEGEEGNPNSGFDGESAGGQRAILGAFHLGVNVAIPEVVDDASGGTGGQGSHYDDPQQEQRGFPLSGQDGCPEGWDHQDEAACRLVPAQETGDRQPGRLSSRVPSGFP